MTERPNILLVVSDATRRDALGCYGGDPAVTPNIDAFARTATVFERAYAASTYTLPAVASMYTALNPGVHQLRMTVPRGSTSFQTDVLPGSMPTMAEILAGAGYDTCCIVANPWLRRFFQLTRGFRLHRYLTVDSAEAIMAEWTLQRERLQEPWFAYIHLMDCHAPFTIRRLARERGFDPERWKTGPGEQRISYRRFIDEFASLRAEDIDALRLLYFGELQYLDGCIGELLAPAGSTVTLFTADHGELLGDRAHHPVRHSCSIAFGHNRTPYEPLIRVPLIIRLPGAAGGNRTPALVGHVDILPTLLEYLDVPGVSGPLQGRSFLGVLRGGIRHRESVVAEKLDYGRMPFEERALVAERWKYIQISRPFYQQSESALSPTWRAVNHRFGALFELLGYVLPADNVTAGGALHLTLYWRARQALKQNLLGMVFFVNHETREVPFYHKFFPVYGWCRPHDWPADRIVEDALVAAIPADAEAGEYDLRVGLFDLDAGESEWAENLFYNGSWIIGAVEVCGRREDGPSGGGGAPRVTVNDPSADQPAGRIVRAAFDRADCRPGEWATLAVDWIRGRGPAGLQVLLVELRHDRFPEFGCRFMFQCGAGIVEAGDPVPAGIVTERVGFQPPPGLPPGEYGLCLGVIAAPVPAGWLSACCRPDRRLQPVAARLRLAGTPDPRLREAFLEVVGVDAMQLRSAPGDTVSFRVLWKRHGGFETGADDGMSLQIVAASGDAVEHPFTAEARPEKARQWPLASVAEQVITVRLPDSFPEGPARVFLVGPTGRPPLETGRIQVWREGNEPDEVLHEELYDLADDPDERVNRAADQRERLASMRDELRGWIRATRLAAEAYSGRSACELDPEIRQQLAALGYFDEE